MKETIIIIRFPTKGWQAWYSDHSQFCGAGPTREAAIVNLLESYPDMSPVELRDKS